MSQVSEKLKQFHDNYLSAKEMISTSENSATKTVQFLPVFRRLYPSSRLEAFKTAREKEEGIYRQEYCQKQCGTKGSQCLGTCINKIDACNNFVKNALLEGHEQIRKIHKEYKLPVAEEEE